MSLRYVSYKYKIVTNYTNRSKGTNMANKRIPKMTYATPLAPLQWATLFGQGKLKYDPNGQLDKADGTNSSTLFNVY